jgi:hypothetical protein
MKSVLLLVGTGLSSALPMPATAEAWSPERWPPALVAAGTAGVGADTAADSRLMLQLAMVFALVYVAFLCAWLSRTRGRRAVGQTRHRVRDTCAALAGSAVALARSVARRPAALPPGPDAPCTCEILWKRGPVLSRFQAVIVTSDDRKRRVVAESARLRWPPKDVRNPPTRELEAALGALVATIVATGWEPVASSGSWSERRFVWRRPGEPPTKLRPGRRSSTGPARAPRTRGVTGSPPLKPARRRGAAATEPGGRLAPSD